MALVIKRRLLEETIMMTSVMLIVMNEVEDKEGMERMILLIRMMVIGMKMVMMVVEGMKGR